MRNNKIKTHWNTIKHIKQQWNANTEIVMIRVKTVMFQIETKLFTRNKLQN